MCTEKQKYKKTFKSADVLGPMKRFAMTRFSAFDNCPPVTVLSLGHPGSRPAWHFHTFSDQVACADWLFSVTLSQLRLEFGIIPRVILPSTTPRTAIRRG